MPSFADRVKDTSTTTGTGSITLAGSAPTGFRTFAAALGAAASEVPYAIVMGAEWEVGYGTLSTSTTLARTTVLASSNAGAAVSFSAGVKDVFLTAPADALNIAGRIAGHNAQTGTTYTFGLTDNGKLVTGNNAAAQTFTVPLNSSAAFPVGKTVINLGQLGAGQITIAATGGVTIRSSGSKLKLTGQWSAGSLAKINTDEWFLFGDIAA
jgi:hypothetical protein